MEMFDRVTVACDTSSRDVGGAIRASLELFRLHVYFHWCVQKRNVIDLLEGRTPETQYLVLCSHGLGSTDRSDKPPRRCAWVFMWWLMSEGSGRRLNLL